MSLFQQKGMIIVIEGIIGVGKSTLSKQLCDHYKSQGLKCKYFPEHVNLEFLNLFISDMKKYAFAFQMYMLERRLEMIRQSEEFILRTNGVAILDRSLHGDYTFGLLHRLNGNMTDEEWNIYEQKVKSIYMIIRPKKVIYLDASIDTCLERCKKRDRKGENNYTAEYFKNLRDCYLQAIDNYDQDILVKLDWNQDGIELERVIQAVENEQPQVVLIDEIENLWHQIGEKHNIRKSQFTESKINKFFASKKQLQNLLKMGKDDTNYQNVLSSKLAKENGFMRGSEEAKKKKSSNKK
jgi:deoxyadenosine/deoxycytidine kinase